jgi:hypothetical protein
MVAKHSQRVRIDSFLCNLYETSIQFQEDFLLAMQFLK